MKRNGRNRFLCVYLIALLSITSGAKAYEINTHELLNRQATLRSGLDTYLKRDLEVSDGIQQTIPGGTILDIISEAGAFEDNGLRFLNHFHNPLEPWNQAGLNDTVFHFSVRGESSLFWAQRGLDPKQGWSWQDARKYFIWR